MIVWRQCLPVCVCNFPQPETVAICHSILAGKREVEGFEPIPAWEAYKTWHEDIPPSSTFTHNVEQKIYVQMIVKIK